MSLNPVEFVYLGLCIEGLLYGLYSGIFIMYLLHYHASKKEGDNPVLFYALCVLYIFCVTMIFADVAASVIRDNSIIYRISIVQIIVFGCYDFIAQSILIYRCWIVWGCNTHVVIIPSILAIAFLVIWMLGGLSMTPDFNVQGRFVVSGLSNTLTITSLVMTMTVNALVMCLIVFRIFKVFQEIKVTTSSEETSMGIIGGSKLWSIMFIIIESGMALFSIQLARVVVSTSLGTTADFDAFDLIVGIHEILNGITPTIILVRVSMGLSFHDEASMVEVVGSFLHFPPNDSDPNSTIEMGSISQGGRDDSDDCTDGNDNIQIVERPTYIVVKDCNTSSEIHGHNHETAILVVPK